MTWQEDAVGPALNTSRSRRFISLQYVHVGYNSRGMSIQKPFRDLVFLDCRSEASQIVKRKTVDLQESRGLARA
jgi:hypothetical protein